jgi:CHASE2 domain-containing sensor protein
MVSQILDAATANDLCSGSGQNGQRWLWIIGWIVIGGILGRVTSHPLPLSIGVAVGLGACASYLLLFVH